MDAQRIAIVGARRQAQGIGEYVARDLAALGADVCAIAGTSKQSVGLARDNLASRYGLTPRGYDSVELMLRSEQLDAVAICSPQQFHRQHLNLALDFGLDTVCEKPLVFDASRDNFADASMVVQRFVDEGRLLLVNQQWPYTLDAFQRCYPENDRARPTNRLEMLLAPAEVGIGMIPNALPHALSMLFAVAPAGGRAEKISLERPARERLRIDFDYVHDGGCVSVSVYLVQCAEQPRPAGYAINGCTVMRRIELPSYQMYFEKTPEPLSGLYGRQGFMRGISVPRDDWLRVEDPLRLLLADFIKRLENPAIPTSAAARILDNVRILDEIYRAAGTRLDH